MPYLCRFPQDMPWQRETPLKATPAAGQRLRSLLGTIARMTAITIKSGVRLADCVSIDSYDGNRIVADAAFHFSYMRFAGFFSSIDIIDFTPLHSLSTRYVGYSFSDFARPCFAAIFFAISSQARRYFSRIFGLSIHLVAAQHQFLQLGHYFT